MSNCPPRSITLFINGLPPLEINPVNTPRSKINFISQGERTAYGSATLKGIAARPPVFIWTISCFLDTRELIRLHEINDLSQARLAVRDNNNAIIFLTDRFQYVNGAAANAFGRAIVETFTLDGLTFHYCAFPTTLELPQDLSSGIDDANLMALHEVKFLAKEV